MLYTLESSISQSQQCLYTLTLHPTPVHWYHEFLLAWNIFSLSRLLILLYIVRNNHCFLFHQKTPLHLAADQGHLDIVRYLVENKTADIYAKDTHEVSMSCSEISLSFVLLFLLKYMGKGFLLFDYRVYANIWNREVLIVKSYFLAYHNLTLQQQLLKRFQMVRRQNRGK